jgi:AraC-like DNA-binding protein
MFEILRYTIKTERLAPWIKFIWRFEADNTEVRHKLLPTDSVDIIMNLSGDMVYETDSDKIHAPCFHINGLRDTYSYIHQTGDIRVLGISFHCFGLYPFARIPLSNIQNKIVDLDLLSAPLKQKLKLAVSGEITVNTIISIEDALCSELRLDNDYAYKAYLIRKFMETEDVTGVQAFCDGRGISVKTFERMVLRYTGYTPKLLRRIRRFQTSCNQLVHENPEMLSFIAYDNNFTDQAHFIKEFHRFSGTAPRAFSREKTTIKENAKYSYY